MKRAELDSKTIPCLLCEQDVQMEQPDTSLADIEKSNFDQGVECRTHGNYGSQVWDTSGVIYFVICDGCLVKHSAKMLVKESDYSSPAEDFAIAMRGENPAPKYKPIRNARDHYDEWFKWLNEKYEKGDSYYDDVSPYFEKELDVACVSDQLRERKEWIRREEAWFAMKGELEAERDALATEVARERKIVGDLRLYIFDDLPALDWPEHDPDGKDAAAEDYACIVAEHGLKVICQHRGHRPMRDQYRKPEHDYCPVCMSPTPDEASSG